MRLQVEEDIVMMVNVVYGVLVLVVPEGGWLWGWGWACVVCVVCEGCEGCEEYELMECDELLENDELMCGGLEC